MKAPCLECGELTEPTDSRGRFYCKDHKPKHPRKPEHVRNSWRERHYRSTAWRRLANHAKRLQPFCAKCGSSNDLQADHLPQAWQRAEKGLPIRLIDIQVLCAPCNREQGNAYGENINHKGRVV